MLTLDIGKQLSGHVFPFLLITTRVGAAMMLFPGIGEAFVPSRIRILFAMAFSCVLYPVLMPHLPPQPNGIPELVLLIAKEALVGLFFGIILRLMMATLETAGSIISVQIGLSNAMILNPALASQSALTSAFLSMAGVALIFITGLDHMLLRAVADTYSIFPAGGEVIVGDVVETYSKMINQSFVVGTELAAPFLVSGLLLFVALGLMQRMMAQIQLFLVVMPLQIWGGLILFSVTLGLILTAWIHYFDDNLGNFINPLAGGVP